ncbi:hypothetical protein [uncultured Jatrophihabitans sp.]|uniref:hypothetical protein n=1 Tax=uncultured Jatrophihabitans sp. TaxID=1610747 RepID=UPI0035C98CB6
MTALLADSKTDNLWATMPGWGIVADLTPPELVAARALKVLRKYIALALAVVVLLCVAGYVWASMQSSAADDRLAASQAATSQLTAENAKYSGVVALQNATQNVNSQVATLLATDIDVAAFVQRLHTVAPAGTTLTTVNVALSASGDPTATSGVTTEPIVGTVTLSGTSRRMVDLAAYVTALQKLRGVVNVIPSTNSATKNGGLATWAVTLQITDKLYTHRYDATAAATTTGGGHR